MKLGTLGEWAGAVGSIAAVAAALWITRFQARLARRRSQEDDAAAMIVRISWKVGARGAPGAVSVTPTYHAAHPVRFLEIRVATDKGDGALMTRLGGPGDPVYTADCLAPGEGVQSVTFKVPVDCKRVNATTRWFDRFGHEWIVVNQGVPHRVPAGERRDFSALAAIPSEL